jgi:hypothetical protein
MKPAHPRAAMLAVCIAWIDIAQGAAVCQAGRVEMIVGGVAPAADCSSPVAGRSQPPASALAAASRGERVAPAVQRERDSDRRRILEDELRHEQDALVQQLRRGETTDADALGRTRANIAALQGELSRLPTAR